MPTYFAARWHHDLDDEPVLIFEELGDDRLELRKVHEFADGRRERTDRIQPELMTSLSRMSIPDLDEIASAPEFTVQPLTAEEFEAAWATAVDAR